MSRYIYALDKNGNRVHIADAQRGDKEYTCCYCHNKMIAKKGTVRAAHFAHAAGCACDEWYGNKGEWHRHMQDLFPKDAQEVILEADGEKHIADVCLQKSNGQRLVIEFQHSSLSREEFVKRTLFWKSNYTDLIWVFDVRACDIRALPGTDDTYRWFRPFACLNYRGNRIASVPVVFYMQPEIKTYWNAHDSDLPRYGTRFTLSHGRKQKVPFFLLDEGGGCGTSIFIEQGSPDVSLRGYQYLRGRKIPDKFMLLEYIKERMGIYCRTRFCEYAYETWVRFRDMTQYETQKVFLDHMVSRSDGSPHKLNIYIEDRHAYKTLDFYESHGELTDILTQRYGPERVITVNNESRP